MRVILEQNDLVMPDDIQMLDYQNKIE